ncbi:MAG: FAD:protein FMN transferase [Solirubrobacterales bacterium]|nr:FAD:protein FMN transferase [Solirubrobacterales bacterium]
MPTAAATTARRTFVEHVMGTVVSLDVRAAADPGAVAPAVARAMAWLHEVDARFSTYRDDSEVSRADRGELSPLALSDDLRLVLGRCAELRAETGGFFDEHAAGRLDPSALVKGWAVQRAADLLAGAGVTDFCLAAGGDLVVRGGALPWPRWRVGIQHPEDRDAVATTIAVTDAAVATSGAYERGEHVLDPHTGRPPSSVLSVTVVGPDLGTADAYATAAFAMGLDGPGWTLTLPGYEAMTILGSGAVLSTPGFPEAA